jgi:hypothetical protein
LFQSILRTIIKEEGGDIDRSCDYDSDSTAGGNDEKTVSHGASVISQEVDTNFSYLAHKQQDRESGRLGKAAPS